MAKRYFTVGMAGHIDHGKTSLVKALTNKETDRLKEEKERGISIELGFAPLLETEEMEVSVIDVPGHEKFIRQMIAGVAGIDLVILVVAADEGVMPQTKEHLEILSFLGVDRGIVVLSKMDNVDEELHSLAMEEIKEELIGTVFEKSPVLLADSISGKGIPEIKQAILGHLEDLPSRSVVGDFRMPIDQVFTVKGQGTVVRGTVYEGSVKEGDSLLLLPSGKETKARQIQVHHKPAPEAFGGQRTAINLSGLSKEEAERGDALVKSEFFTVTETIDISLNLVDELEHPVKQRMPIKLHTGTSETMGKIIFFDRNDAEAGSEDILCQVRLEDRIVVKRNDRLILRRPTPAETIGGGFIIDPNGGRYKFGNETIQLLMQKKNGTPLQRAGDALERQKVLSKPQFLQETSLSSPALQELLEEGTVFQLPNGDLTAVFVLEQIIQLMNTELRAFHDKNPLKAGYDKARLIQLYKDTYKESLLDYAVKRNLHSEKWKQKGHYLSLSDFTPHVPSQWKKRSQQVLEQLEKDGMKPEEMAFYLEQAGIPADMQGSLLQHYREQELVVFLDEKLAFHAKVFHTAVRSLQAETEREFELSEAKDTLGLSRKYLIPFLETLDNQGLTVRVENKRKWRSAAH
ncbi:selenocysteine-specific translation elongation factor [Rossellomorea vietnamensis]|uniref:Selenocysteine-specific elongation factor n=1 Tax=Rossellomorea vietnamensis TaxID=218284 RepID=A0A5D4MGU7_9BACI|nr:selenocysteine-specific translation elongation factor [Rossellomorea vietnamensis]TYS00286.1 selenocysteine-specific translation elongation factor [Rossellomorea vietnamensis]